MFFIMGTDGKVQQVGMAEVTCPQCGRRGTFVLCKCFEYVQIGRASCRERV